jgi:DNA-binding response OmpR family regulator
MAVVVVVDDEVKIRQLVRAYLEREGHTVIEAATASAAVELAGAADLMILDLGLPDRSGQDVAREIRRSTDLPIIMLTARAGEAERIGGLRLGADDYVTKPFSPGELVARVAAVLRRTTGDTAIAGRASYGHGALRIDTAHRGVTVDDRPIALTRSEFDLLTALAARPGRVWSRRELTSRVRGDRDGDAAERAIDAHVKNLRHKLGDPAAAARLVATVAGVGYKLGLDRDD